MKKILFVIIIVAFGSISYLCIHNLVKSTNNTNVTIDNSKLFHAKMAFYANSLDELIDQSPIIVVVTIGNNIGEVEFGPVTYFTFTEVKVDDVIKGEGLIKDDKINIIQTKYLIEDPVLEKKSKKILFLIKYDSKEYADNDYTYACVGGYQGIYNINDDGTITNSLMSEDLLMNIAGKDDVNDNSTVVDTENMLKDFAGGKTKDKFINEINELK